MRFVSSKFVMLFCFSLLGQQLYAQPDYEARGFSEKDGMCAQGANALAVDDDGFVWITSENGVSRFDGSSFYCFRHEDNDPNSLLANKCDYVFKDKKGGLWIKSLYGLSRYDKTTQRFINFTAGPGVFSGILGGKMTEDSQGRLWLGGYGDVIIFDPASRAFKKSGWINYAKKAGLLKQEKRNNAALEIMPKNESELYILSVYGLFSVNTETGEFAYHPNPQIDDYWAFYLNYIDAEGRVWIGTYDQCFYIYDPRSGKWVHEKCREGSPPMITDIWPVGRDSLVMLSDKKLWLYRPSLATFSPQTFEFSESGEGATIGSFWKTYISGEQVYFILSGNLPLVQMRRPAGGWLENKLQLPRGFTNNVAQHSGVKNYIVIGDWNQREVLWYDLQSNQYSSIRDQEGNKNLGVFQSFYKLNEGLGILIVSDKIYTLDLSMMTAQLIPTARYQQAFVPEFRNVVQDYKNQLYVRERNSGIWFINTTAQRVEPYFSPNSKGNFSDLYFEASTRKFWLAQERNGVFVIESNKLTNRHYPLQVEERGGPSTINSITGDGNGKVYLALLDHGLLVVDAPRMQVKRFTQAMGLPTDIVSFGGLDDRGNYWGTSQSGLYCLQNGKIINYSKHRTGKQFFHRISSDGTGYFMQNLFPSTILRFHPGGLLDDLEPGYLYLSEVRVLGKKIYDVSTLRFSPDQNSISFIIGCLLQKDWMPPQCEYSINGSRWQPFDINRELNFFNLAPDDYRLQIRRSDREIQPLDIYFVVSPPWYRNKAFWIILGLVVLGMLYGLYTYRIGKVKKEEEVKNEMTKAIAKMEMAALRAQMNPHFIFNCLNSINRFILTHDTEQASDYLTRFSRLIRMTLDNSREELISLEKELSALRIYLDLEAMRFHDTFQWNINVSEQLDTGAWMIPPTTLQPYVENAIWHGLLPVTDPHSLKVLNISVEEEGPSGICITIRDNGVGRKQEGVHASDKKSHGMALTADRLKWLEQTSGMKISVQVIDLKDHNNNASGTLVEIKMKRE